MSVLHWDDNKLNNRVENLRYGTQTDNMADMRRNGRNSHIARITCKRGHKLKEPNIVANKAKNGWRECLACNRATSYIYYHKDMKPFLCKIADSYYQKIMEKAA